MRSPLVVSLVLVAFAVWLLPADAFAQPLGPAETQVNAAMEDYFAGEKAQGWGFIGIGAVGVGTGSYLFVRGDDRSRGASYPVFAIGLFSALAGTGVLFTTPTRVADNRARIVSDPGGFKATETERMEGVMTRFTIIQYAELGLILGGLGLFTYGSLRKRETLEGLGLGLAASAAVLLGLDFTAAGRGDAYLARLRGFQPSVTRTGMFLGYKAPF